jgi:hypothetical protein
MTLRVTTLCDGTSHIDDFPGKRFFINGADLSLEM